MQVQFTSPTSAALPQEELHSLSHTQLVQAANVLHAGWMAANKKVSSVERQVEQLTRAHAKEMEDITDRLFDATSNFGDLSQRYSSMVSRHHQLETELIQMKRAFAQHRNCKKESVDSDEQLEPPEVSILNEKLLLANADIIRLERLVGLQTPLDVEQLLAELNILRQQRESDKVRLQEASVNIEHMRIQYELAQEELDQRAKPKQTTETKKDRRESVLGSSVRSILLSKVSNAERSSPPDVEKESSGTQTEAYLLHAIDLWEQSNEKNKQLTTDVTALKVESAQKDATISGLKEQIAKLKVSVERKGALLAEFTNRVEGQFQRSHSSGSEMSAVAGAANVEYSRNTSQELRDKLIRRESENVQLEEKLRVATLKCQNAERTAEKVGQSIRMMAEENAKLTHQVQVLSNMNPKKLQELLATADNATQLRDRLKALEAEARQVKALHEELQNSKREIATLDVRVCKYQSEITMINSKKESLFKEVRKLTAENEELKKQLSEASADLELFAEKADAAEELQAAVFKGKQFAMLEFCNALRKNAGIFCEEAALNIAETVLAKHRALHLQSVSLCVGLVQRVADTRKMQEEVRRLSDALDKANTEVDVLREIAEKKTAECKNLLDEFTNFKTLALESGDTSNRPPAAEAEASETPSGHAEDALPSERRNRSASGDTAQEAPRLGMAIAEVHSGDSSSDVKLVVESVEKGSSAETAAIAPQDIIADVAGTAVASMVDLERAVAVALQTTRAIKIRFVRGGRSETTVLLL